MMRTTLDLDDDVLALLRQVADATGASVGATASDLIRCGLSASRPLLERKGLLLFPPPNSGVVVTSALVKRLLDELP